MTKDFLPCPFCGSESVGLWKNGCVVCHQCGAEGPVPLVDTREDATREWNKRVKHE